MEKYTQVNVAQHAELKLFLNLPAKFVPTFRIDYTKRA